MHDPCQERGSAELNEKDGKSLVLFCFKDWRILAVNSLALAVEL